MGLMVTSTQPCHLSTKAAAGFKLKDGCGGAPIKLLMDTEIGISCNLHMSQIILLICFQPLRNMKPSLCSALHYLPFEDFGCLFISVSTGFVSPRLF